MSIELAVIGGTGLTEIKELEIARHEVVHTPYGEPSGPITHGILYGKEVVFLARHGHSHNVPPHKVNYRANLWALKRIGVKRVVAVTAVGGISAAMRPQHLVIPDQIIDYTYGREHTFFDEDLTEVTHIDFSYPYCPMLRKALLEAAKLKQLHALDGGTYGATQGPRLETSAEINRMGHDGCDIVGMTGMPEASLARELDLNYACCALVVNWAAGLDSKPVTMDIIAENADAGMLNVKQLLDGLLAGDCLSNDC